MTVRRVLTLTLILLLALMPTGLAESVYGQLTLDNFQVALVGNEPVDVDAVLKLGGGYSEEDGLFRADAELTGGGKTAFTTSMDAAEDALRVKLGGANIYFTLPFAALDAYTRESGQYAGVFKDRKSFVDYIAKTMSASDMGINPLEKPISAARKALKAEPKGEEPVELFGKTMTLYRFDGSLNGEEVGGFLEALAGSDDSLQTSIEGFLLSMAKAVGMDEWKLSDISDAFASIIEKSKLDVRADATFWVDAEALADDAVRCTKATAKLTMTEPAAAGEKASTAEFTIDLATMDKGEGEYSTLAIHMPAGLFGQIDTRFEGAYNVPKDGGTTDNTTITAKSNGVGSTPVDVRIVYENVTDASGVADASFTLNMKIKGQPINVHFQYDGKTATANRYEGAVTIDFAVEEFTGSLKFDSLLETSPLVPLTDADFEGLKAVNPMDPKDENAKLVMPEMAAVGAKASGVLMTTPGIPHLMSIFKPVE